MNEYVDRHIKVALMLPYKMKSLPSIVPLYTEKGGVVKEQPPHIASLLVKLIHHVDKWLR